MLFNSYEFILLFLPVTFAGFFWVARSSHRLAALWLAVASLFFYGWWNPKFVLLLLLSIVFNYAMGYAIGHAIHAGKRAKSLLITAVALDLGLLGYFKYTNFFISTANIISGHDWGLADIVLPLGISFFTFTQIAFIVDVYRGIAKEYSFIHYILFVTYFPHLIAGPVLHHKQMMPQFAISGTYRVRVENIAIGLAIFTIGLAKKVLLADDFSEYATLVFDAAKHGVQPEFISAWMGALAYAMQLYFDFSGYADMAIGLSLLFGITLPLNFNSPYKAYNIIEFWRRWHMTLSQFLKDYLYIPLGGNRLGPSRRYVNLLATMLLGGLWHGANWTFVAWGGLHGIYLIANHVWIDLKRKLGLPNEPSLAWRILNTAITFTAVVVAWVFFRAESMDSALVMLSGMSQPSSALPYFLGKKATILFATGLLIVFFMPNSQTVGYWLGQHQYAVWRKINLSIVFGSVAGCIFAIAFLTLQKKSEFLYFQF